MICNHLNKYDKEIYILHAALNTASQWIMKVPFITMNSLLHTCYKVLATPGIIYICIYIYGVCCVHRSYIYIYS